MTTSIQVNPKQYDSHEPIDAPMPTTSEQELKAKKSCWDDCFNKKKVKHKHQETVWEYKLEDEKKAEKK